MDKKTTVLMILDGFGLNEKTEGNAIAQAVTPNLDYLTQNYPFVKGFASGLDVGLPDGQMGNSEVGHLNIGAGRVVYQELTHITKSIEEGGFFTNAALSEAVENCKKNNSGLHLYGLVSDGGVHSHNTHLYALLELAKRHGLQKVYVHAFLDGRDTPPNSGLGYVNGLEQKIKEIGAGEIATVQGRFYAMDRDNRYERVLRAYNAMVCGEGEQAASAPEAVQKSYDKGPKFYDEFMEPAVIVKNGAPVGKIRENDSVVCFNFRPDRAREITRSLTDPAFSGFERKNGYFKVFCVCFTEIDVTIPNKTVAFLPVGLTNTLGEYLQNKSLTQLRLAETEKYAHVTFFFNGGVETKYGGEERVLIPSPKVPTYDMQPEMSARAVCDALLAAVASRKFDLIIINFANCDMVGHTGIMEAAVKAVETVDECVGKAYKAVVEAGGVLFICADHGNSDQMIDYETGEPFTAHTTNPVPFILVNYDKSVKLRGGGRLCDIAPTLLEIMGLPKPGEITGESLLVKA